MNLRTWTLAMAVGAIHLACTTAGTKTSNGASPDGGSVPPGSSDAGTPAGGLSCLEVLKCVADCPDSDGDACVDGCVDRARASSQNLTDALRQCLDGNACADADCINAKCKNELDACLADAPEQGTPSTGPTTTGSLPSGLVGTWSSVGLSSGTVWTFEADGQTTTAFELETSLGTCTYKTSVTSSGVTTATADAFVYHRSSGTQVLKDCTSTKSTALAAVDSTYRYELGTYEDGQPKLTIHVVNADGTINPSGTELHH